MKKVTSTIFLLLAIFGLFAGCSLAGGRAVAAPALPKNKNLLRTTLSNGLKVVVIPSTLAPVATSVLSYRVGGADSPKNAPGLAHALAHLVFAGGPGVSSAEMAGVIRKIGGDVHAETTAGETSYIYTVPTSDLGAALHLEALSMAGITKDPAEWQSVRRELDAEIASDNTNPQFSLFSTLRADLLKATPYAHVALGKSSTIDGVTLGELRRFHDAWYVPNNATLVVTGAFKASEVMKEIKGDFAHFQSKDLPARPTFNPQAVVPESLALTSHLAYGAAAISLRMPGYESSDYPAALVLSEVIRTEKGGLQALVSSGAAFGAGFSYDVYPRTGIGTMVAAYSPGQDGSAVKEQLKLALAKYMNGGIPEKSVSEAKLRAVLNLQASLDSSSGLALGWAHSLSHGDRSPQQLLSEIEKVTTQQVNKAAVRYIDLGKADFATLTPAKKGKTVPLSSQGYGGPEQIVPTGPSATTLPTWATSGVGKAATGAKLSDRRLANGLRLIVEPEHNSAAVEVYGLVNSNPYVQVPKGQEGVDEVLGQLLSDGTSSMTRTEFDSELAKVGADETGGTRFSLTVLSSGLSRGMSLLAQNLLHPRLKAKDFAAEQKLIEQIVTARAQNPAVQAREAFLAAVLPKGDPALRQATSDTVKALTLADVKSYYRAVFRPDMTTIVIIGDTTPEKARQIVQQYFGSWKNRGKRPNILLPSGVPNKPSMTHINDPSSMIDQVRMAESIPMVRSNPGYYALQLGNEILSGGPGTGLFAKALSAGNTHASYLTASYISGRSRTFYLIDFADSPSDVKRASGIIEASIRALQQTPPTTAELDKARSSLIQGQVLSAVDYSSIADGLLNRVRLGLPLDEPAHAAQVYAGISPKQVSAAMAKWVRPADFAVVDQGPKSQAQ